MSRSCSKSLVGVYRKPTDVSDISYRLARPYTALTGALLWGLRHGSFSPLRPDDTKSNIAEKPVELYELVSLRRLDRCRDY